MSLNRVKEQLTIDELIERLKPLAKTDLRNKQAVLKNGLALDNLALGNEQYDLRAYTKRVWEEGK